MLGVTFHILLLMLIVSAICDAHRKLGRKHHSTKTTHHTTPTSKKCEKGGVTTMGSDSFKRPLSTLLLPPHTLHSMCSANAPTPLTESARARRTGKSAIRHARLVDWATDSVTRFRRFSSTALRSASVLARTRRITAKRALLRPRPSRVVGLWSIRRGSKGLSRK